MDDAEPVGNGVVTSRLQFCFEFLEGSPPLALRAHEERERCAPEGRGDPQSSSRRWLQLFRKRH
jgi:hypothetical protein